MPDRHSGCGGLLQRLQPVLTLVIAVVAIGLAGWEGLENRRHNRLSVQPRIGADINSGQDGGGEYIRMSIESTGSALEAFGTGETQINARGIGRGYYLPAGSRHLLFEARRPRPDASAPPLSSNLGRLALQVCFCSVYQTDCDEVLLTTGELVPLSCTRGR